MVRKLDGSACTKVVCGEVRSEPCPFVGCMLASLREREREVGRSETIHREVKRVEVWGFYGGEWGWI